MPDNNANNKRIAKNTLLLYARMLYSLIISLFTSRVILQSLGFDDYGLYNAVGSVVTMFVFLHSAMGNSVQRFITYALGKNDDNRLRDVFSMSLMIHSALAIIIIILCETVGIWFLNEKMTIPAGREIAANWVLQFSILSCALTVMCIPYDAEIIAHERMGIFAVIQALNSTLNLVIAFAIKYTNFDRLIFYAFLILMVQVVNRIIYGIYCSLHFPETKFHWVKDKSLFREMTGFAGWSLIGNLAFVGYTSGLNLLINIFFGPAVNAARGIAVQIQGAIKGFVTNFQMSVNPQITKSYAQEDYPRLHSLVYTSSKLSYFLLLCLVLPVSIEVNLILHIWLGDIPDYTAPFVIMTLAILLVEPLANPLNTANDATGEIRTYQIVEGGVLLSIIPLAYFAIKIWNDPVVVFYVQLGIFILTHILRIFLVCHKIKMSIREYITKVILRVIIVTIVSLILPLILFAYLDKTVLTGLFVIVMSIFSVIITAYMLGLDVSERRSLNIKLAKFKNKILRKSCR